MSSDVLVIGGGVAGLSAASALAARGVRTLLLEARPTLGGRTSAFVDPGTGERVDNGQHVLFGCYHETFRFLRRIGAASHVHLQSNLSVDIVERGGRVSTLACPPLPSPFHLLVGLLRWDALTWRDRIAAGRMWRAIVADRFRLRSQRDTPTVRRWLERLGQTPRLIELLWEPLAVAALNQSIDVAAAKPFSNVLDRMLRTRHDTTLGLPRKPLDALFAEPSREFIERCGGAVRTGSPVDRVLSSPPDTQLQVLVRDEELSARAVICAVPWYALPDLFPERPAALAVVLEAAERTNSSPLVTINFWFDRSVTTGAFIGLPGRACQWVFDKRVLFGETSSHLSLVSSGAEALVGRTNREIIEVALSELTEALPAVRSATLKRAVVVREKRATFSVAPGLPARPATTTLIPGLFLAGDWIDTGLPATIESAVASGHAAAHEVLQYLRP